MTFNFNYFQKITNFVFAQNVARTSNNYTLNLTNAITYNIINTFRCIYRRPLPIITRFNIVCSTNYIEFCACDLYSLHTFIMRRKSKNVEKHGIVCIVFNCQYGNIKEMCLLSQYKHQKGNIVRINFTKRVCISILYILYRILYYI